MVGRWGCVGGEKGGERDGGMMGKEEVRVKEGGMRGERVWGMGGMGSWCVWGDGKGIG